MLVRTALIGRGGLVADGGRPGIEGERLQPSVDDCTVLGGAAHHRRPDVEARLEGLGRLAVAVAGARGSVDRLGDRLTALVPAPQVLGRAVIRL